VTSPIRRRSPIQVLSGAEVRRILARELFVEVRRRGSHGVMQRRLGDSTLTLPDPDHRELRPGTLAAIIPQSRLARSHFEV